ncbi:MAG: hypothetical protein U0575_08420 [Phycisphaerales bacterium]
MIVPWFTSRPCRKHQFVVLGCAVTAVLLAATPRADAVHPPRVLVHWLLTDIGSLPPPPISPAILQQFWHLYTTYQASKADASMPFSQWLVVNGVTDPHTFEAMMLLYHWYMQNHEVV